MVTTDRDPPHPWVLHRGARSYTRGQPTTGSALAKLTGRLFELVCSSSPPASSITGESASDRTRTTTAVAAPAPAEWKRRRPLAVHADRIITRIQARVSCAARNCHPFMWCRQLRDGRTKYIKRVVCVSVAMSARPAFLTSKDEIWNSLLSLWWFFFCFFFSFWLKKLPESHSD